MAGKPLHSSSISGQGMQPRFVRSHVSPYGATDKARFVSRARPLHRLRRYVNFLMLPFGLRRSRRVTTVVAVTLFFVVTAVGLLFFSRLVHPRSLTRFRESVEDVKTGVLDLTSQVTGLGAGGSWTSPLSSSNHANNVDNMLEDSINASNGGAVASNDSGKAGAEDGDLGDDDDMDAARQDAKDAGDNSDASAKISTDIGGLHTGDVRKKYAAEKLSIVVLFHNEYDSLKGTFRTWVDNGLIDYADEVLFFLNGGIESTFRKRMPEFETEIPKEKGKLVASKRNLPLGQAIVKMVELAKYEYVLLLEKDWALIEDKPVLKSRLDDSKVVVGTGVAHLIRHRHRHNPGVPLHALIMHDGREEAIMRVQPNLLCFVHHWQKDPTTMYPGAGIMHRCGGKENNMEEEDVFCSSSKYCQWTNNPCVFRKTWFMDEVGDRYRKEYDLEFAKHGKTSPFLDFEYYTNWRSYAWTDKNFTIAVGTGLFSHAESEHRHFNTFWYAHYRLTVDMEEIRNMYLRNETAFKKLGGVHYHPQSPVPPTMMERYPVEFARKFHWDRIFTGTLEDQKKIIDDRYQEFLSKYRFLDVDEWEKGRDSAKAKNAVNWRMGITDLHHIVEKAEMIAPFEQPHEMNITLVTCLLDLGRDELAEDGYQFRREFKMYLDAMEDWLTHKYPKVVYTSKRIAEEMEKKMNDESKKTTHFVITSREELRTKWLGPDNYDRVQEIRTSKEWKARASWLENSPQAGLKDYNPLVMSKMFMIRDAARNNYFNTTHFVFIDSKHNCQRPKIMTPKNDHIIRAHMINQFLLTTFDYTPSTEVHGFEYSEFNRYLNLRDPEKKQLVKVGRGGIFGGSAFVLEYITAMYDIALTATLRQGLMGTEENILSIVRYQVKQYVDDFSNNWACPEKIEKDHACPNLKDQGYNCAIFDWVSRNAVRDE